MFETKPPVPATAKSVAAPQDVEEELRAISWADLAAKLAAAREGRVASGKGNESNAASFDAQSAQHLAEMDEVENGDNHDAVNLTDLGNRKGAGGINNANEEQQRPAIRGNT